VKNRLGLDARSLLVCCKCKTPEGVLEETQACAWGLLGFE
jgi:hypothetical protein